MQSRRPSPVAKRPSEEGYVLVAVMFLLVLLVLALSVAAPRMRASIELDRERETMQRGKQYARAIKLYYKTFTAYPPNIDALVKTNNIRFLRKRYTDPMTGKDDWRPIHFGENKTPMAMGFFGQALATGSTLAGTGVSGGNSLTGSSSLFSDGTSTSSTSTSTSPTSGGDSSASTSSTGTGSTSGSSTSSTSGQTFGGAGIVGFAPGKQAQSILLLKKKDHFNEWEFLYSPAQDQKTITSGSATTANGASTSSTSSTTSTTTSSSSSTP